MLKFSGEAAQNSLHEVGLPVTSLFRSQFYGIGKLYMRFTKMSLECDPYFLDRSKTITGLDVFLELSSLVDDVIGLRDNFRLGIGTFCHVTIFEKVFNFVENIVNWGDRVIVNFGHFILEIVELAW